jgi:anti-sigma regulatory factor (Ser/Thr protein kinase)
MKLVINNSMSYAVCNVFSIKNGVNAIIMKYPKKYHNKIKIGVQELVVNAIEHGSIGVGSKKKYDLKRLGARVYKKYLNEQLKDQEPPTIDITYEENNTMIKLIISDHGKGFDWKKVLINEKNNTQDDGLGMLMSQGSFDELSYNDVGNIVTAVVYKK